MQSSDDSAGRITPDLLEKLVRVADVDELTRSERDAWTGDVELASGMSGEFGAVAMPIVNNGEVVYGWDAVAAEQAEGRDDGRMVVVDITGLDWPRERVWALVAGLHRRQERMTVDQKALADLLLEIQREEPALLDAIGWADSDLDDLIAAVSVPTLGALADEHGGVRADEHHNDFWPWIKVQVNPETFARWQEAFDDAPGRNDSEKVEYLLGGGEP